MWPVAKSGEPKAKRTRRDVAFGEEENPLSRGSMWPVANQQERKNGSTSVEKTGHLSVRGLKTARIPVLWGPGGALPLCSVG